MVTLEREGSEFVDLADYVCKSIVRFFHSEFLDHLLRDGERRILCKIHSKSDRLMLPLTFWGSSHVKLKAVRITFRGRRFHTSTITWQVSSTADNVESLSACRVGLVNAAPLVRTAPTE